MSNNKIFYIGVCLFFVAACKSKKVGSGVSANAETTSKYWTSQFDSEYVEARGKASITTDGKTTNVSMHLKMKEDSVVWGKFSLFGIGATVLITPDSFFMINTLKGEYMKYSNTYLRNYLGFKPTVGQVQNLLLGNAIFGKDVYEIGQSSEDLLGRQGVATNILQISKEYRTFTSKFRSIDTSQVADIQYSTYKIVNEKLMPTILSIFVSQPGQKLNVVLNYQNVNTSRIATFPFKIPNGYVRKN